MLKRNFINGEFIAGEHVGLNINPSDTSDVIGEYVQANLEQANTAIDAAYQAFPAWANGNLQSRADALDFIGNELIARKGELGDLLAREEGKTLMEAIGEVARAGYIFKFFAGEVMRLRGDKLGSPRANVDVEVTREPVGVVGIITPWNFPIAIPAWKIAPALAYGNTVVFKPADLVPGSAWALAEIIGRAGVPAGVFNLVMGRGNVVGQALIDNPKVHAISFTGSVPTGRRVMQGASQRFAKLQLEMGGKNPHIVLDDADLDLAVQTVVQSAYYSTGQRCTAASRFIVQKGIYNKFVDGVTERLRSLRVGDARKFGTDIGPVVDQVQLEHDLQYVDIGRHEGAKLLCGGERLARDTEGFYLAPAFFADAHNGMRLAQEEIFGPVACAIPVNSYEEALAVANDTPFGLSAGISTTSLKYANHFKRHAQAGMVMVNVPTAGVDYHVPFGGRKGSSHGAREQGSYAAEFFTTVKTSYTFS